jgi:1,4-dihydroxy-2-naphthoate polyprenyltransferase
MNKSELVRVWHGFWQLADPKIWIASTIPMAAGGAMAYAEQGAFSWFWFLAGVGAIYMIEIGKNAFNEYVDYLSGVDLFVAPDKRTPFSGGKKTIVDGKLKLKETVLIGLATMGAGGLIGLFVVYYREFHILWFGLAGFFFSLFYSLPPLKFSYRGLGELSVGLTFGPLITCGTYLVQAHTVSPAVVLASLPLGFLIANVLWINQYPDYEADLKGGKLNWVVRLGKEKGVKVYALLFAAAFMLIIVNALVSRNFFLLLPLLDVPLAWRAIKVARSYFDDIPRLMEANIKTIQVYQLFGLAVVAAVLAPLLFF